MAEKSLNFHTEAQTLMHHLSNNGVIFTEKALENFNEWALGPSPSACATGPLCSARSLLQMSFTSFWELYTITCEGQPVSKSSFIRAWKNGNWSEKIKFVPAGHHSSCAECERLREWRRVSKTDSDRAKVEEARNAHISKLMLDRATISRQDEIARRSFHQNYIELSADIRHGAMTIDGMDQAK